MPKASYARAHDTCPLCGKTFKDNPSASKFVYHREPPSTGFLNGKDGLISRLKASGDLKPNYREYNRATGRCPFQQGQKDR